MTSTTAGRRGFNLAPLQKFGRSLMLPIAALPAAALLLRLGQADLLGADGWGWVKVAAVVGAAGNALFANLPLLFAVGVAIGMAKKADGSTALAAVVGYLVFKGVGDALSPFVLDPPAEGRHAGADQLRRPRRHRHGHHGRLAVAALLPDQAAGLPRVLRRAPVRADDHCRRGHHHLGAVQPRLPGVQRGPQKRLRLGCRQRRHRRLRLRHAQPPADPARPAPHPQLRPVVPVRRLHELRRNSRARRHSRGSSPATRMPDPS